jgi:hypothetical protein
MMEPILARAYRAYFMSAAREGYEVDQPSGNLSGQEEVGDKSYVVLRNAKGILAVYRIRHDDMLKRLKRWPAELGEASNGKHTDEWRRSK